eukprot:GHVL01007585.1.p1 GENE.GHVL01007585.1~~GHVL01007585.1.p1  ORF type:complete len:100 (-),score=7.01 GHVL01007585.1:493-792(-)
MHLWLPCTNKSEMYVHYIFQDQSHHSGTKKVTLNQTEIMKMNVPCTQHYMLTAKIAHSRDLAIYVSNRMHTYSVWIADIVGKTHHEKKEYTLRKNPRLK